MGLSNIQWTDYTFNPWRGCRKVAPECANCYIVTTTPFRVAGQTHGAVRVRASAATLRSPLAWNRKALADYDRANPWCATGPSVPVARPRVFCLSLGDWLDDENVPIEWLADLLRVIHETPHLDWLLLTKRPQNFRARLILAAGNALTPVEGGALSNALTEWMDDWRLGKPPANVWIGVSAGADQAAALDIPARVHFLSCEPMLKPLDATYAARFDWIIFGGESGKKARPCDLSWIRDGVAFCRASGAAPFVKQLGSRPTRGPLALAPLKDSHGGDMSEWPEDLRVREFPNPLR